MTDDKALPTVDTLKENIDAAFRRYRAAVRWLSEAKKFKAEFTGVDDWKGGPEGELASIANKTYREAANEVVRSRRALENARLDYKRAVH